MKSPGNPKRGRRRWPAGPQRPDSFGPFQALTALTDVQRLGLDAATQVVRGFADLLDIQPPGTPPAPDPAGDREPASGSEPANRHEPDLAQLRVIVARALDLYADLVRRSFEGYAELMEQMLRSGGVEFDSGPGGLLTLQGAAGARATGTHQDSTAALAAERSSKGRLQHLDLGPAPYQDRAQHLPHDPSLPHRRQGWSVITRPTPPLARPPTCPAYSLRPLTAEGPGRRL